MNRVRSLLSCHLDFSWYSGLNFNHRFYHQTDAHTGKTSLTRENKIDLSRSWGCGGFKESTCFRHSLLFFSSVKKEKKGSSALKVLCFVNYCFFQFFPLLFYTTRIAYNLARGNVKWLDITEAVSEFNRMESFLHCRVALLNNMPTCGKWKSTGNFKYIALLFLFCFLSPCTLWKWSANVWVLEFP